MTERTPVTEEILQDCVQRVASGDPGGAYDLALTWIGHIPERKSWHDVYVAEALLHYAANSNVGDSRDYLASTWPRLKQHFRERFGPKP
jgi:hypothetical protein